MRPVNNYRTKVNYELYGITFPGSVYESFSTSWQEINKDLIKSDNFGEAVMFSTANTKRNDQLVPERTNSIEFGLEAAAWEGRLRLDASLYKTNTTNATRN